MLRPVPTALGLCLLVAGCAHTHVSPAPTPAHGESPRRCTAAASVVVLDTQAAPGSDAVETQRAILESQFFARTAPPELELRQQLHVRRIGRSAVLQVRLDGEAERAQMACEWVLRRLTEAPENPARDWLQTQAEQLRQRVGAAESALEDYDRENHFLTARPSDRLEGITRALVAIEAGRSSATRAERDRLQQAALDLNIQNIERSRLVRTLETVRALHRGLRERLAELELAAMLNPPIRVLDACAPCAP